MNRPHALLWAALSVLASTAVIAGPSVTPSPPQDTAAAISSQECATCHEAAVSKFATTHHAANAGSCQSCHGADVAAHLKSNLEKGEPGPTDTISLKKKPKKEVSEVCMTCHEKSHHPTWAGSTHDRRGVGCTDCHSVHEPKSIKSQLKTASEAETCFSCHPAMRAQSMRTSHHPVREGLMGCSDCHNPHDGSRPKMIKADYTNELCLQCHAEKRGPFFWEHAPVRENCLNCHNPHGSNHDKMLVSQQPWLCQRCHLNTRHPGTLYTGVNAGTGVSTATNRAVEHACKNCHQSVHGGNAPTAPYLGR